MNFVCKVSTLQVDSVVVPCVLESRRVRAMWRGTKMNEEVVSAKDSRDRAHVARRYTSSPIDLCLSLSEPIVPSQTDSRITQPEREDTAEGASQILIQL